MRMGAVPVTWRRLARDWTVAAALVCAIALPEHALAGPGSISGHIVRADNSDPVEGASVELRDPAGAPVPSGNAQTGADGAYTIPDVPAGSYIVLAYSAFEGLALTFHPGTGAPTEAVPIEVGADASVTGVDLALPLGGTVSGRMFQAGTNTGLFGDDTFVALVDWVTNAFIFGITVQGSNGSYVFPNIIHPDVLYAVRAGKPGFGTLWYSGKINWWLSDPVGVVGGFATPNIDFPLPLEARITGRITGSNAPGGISGAEVTLFEATSFSFVAATTTASDGTYAFEDLPPGSYNLSSGKPGYVTRFFNGTPSGTSGPALGPSTIITAAAGATAVNRNIELPQGGDVSGTIHQGDGTTPVPSASVEAFQATTNAFIAHVITNTSGQYSFDGRLPVGSVKLRASAPGFATTFYAQQYTFDSATSIPVTAGGAASGLDVNLVTGGGIKGQIRRGSDGTPVDVATIDVFDASGTFVTNASSDGSGMYDTGRTLLPGQYKVRAYVRGPENLVDTFYANPGDFDGGYQTIGLDLTTASNIVVTAGLDAENVDVELPVGGSISGTLRSKITNAPIANARVFAGRFDASNFSGEYSVLTDAAGQYTIHGLRPGDWVVSSVPPGFQAAAYSGVPSTPAGDLGSAKFVRIQGGSVVTDVSMNLTPGGGIITGRITRGDTGQPLPAGTPVQARGPFPRTAFVASTTTNANGEYTLSGLPPGQYVVEGRGRQEENGFAVGWYPTGTRSRATGLPVPVANNAVTPGVDFQVTGFGGGESPRRVTGVVKNALHQRIPFAGIGIFDRESGSTVRFTTANGDGSYVLDMLEPDRYFVGAETETTYEQRVYPNEPNGGGSPLDVGADAVADFFLPPTAGTVSGKVTRAGTTTPIAGASVAALTWFQTFMGGATTTADGTFVIRGLPAGQYKIRVVAPGSLVGFYGGAAPATLSFAGGVFVVVAASADTPNVNVALGAGGGTISGTIRDPASSPVQGASVTLRDVAGSLVRSVSTLVDGSYQVTGLPTGDYVVAVNAPTLQLATQWYAGKPHQAAADLVHVTAPENTGSVDFQLSGEQGKISGTIRAAEGGAVPIAGAGVVVFDRETGAFVRGAGLTGSSGAYEAAGLAPGSYVIQARAPGRVREFFDDANALGQATEVTITGGGEASGRDFALPVSGDIVGQIAYAGLQKGSVHVRLFADPALTDQRAEVVLGGSTFPRAFSFLSTGPDVNGLPPGTYYLSAYVDSIANGVQDVGEAAAVLGVPDPLVVASVVPAGTLTLQNPSPASILQFSQPSYSVTEGGTATITVIRTGSTTGQVAVDYETSDGTAIAPTHYAAKTGTLTFGSGQSQMSFQVVTVNDPATLNEPRALILRLKNPVGAQVSDRETSMLMILNNDLGGLAKFSAASYSAPDAAATVTIGVARTGGTAENVSVKYRTGSAGTAVAGVDYTAIPETDLTFGAGQASTTFPLTILGNFIAGDAPKTVELLLAPGAGTTVGAPNRVFLTITNNDTGGGLRFDVASKSVPESPLNSITVNVTRPAGPSLAENVTVQVVAVDGTAKLGVDYGPPSPAVVTFGANETSKPVTVPLLLNPSAVASRSFSLKLQSPTGGATLASPSTVTLTITKVGFRFSQTAYTVNEPPGPGPATATITVLRTGTGPASVNVSSTPQTAQVGVDYNLLPAPEPVTVSFTGTETSKTVQVQVLNNPGTLANRLLALTLSNGVGGIVGIPHDATLTILDRDRSELELSQFSAPPVVIAGKPFVVANTVRNASGLAVAATTLRFALSTDTVYDNAPTDATLLNRAVPALGAGATSAASSTITIPAAQPPGAYKLLALVDVNDTVVEQEPGNNLQFRDLTVVASLVKTFAVSGSLTQVDCVSPLREGASLAQGSLVFATQAGSSLTGTLIINYPLTSGLKTAATVTATVDALGALTGTGAYTATQGSTVISKGTVSLSGTVSGPGSSVLTLALSAQSASGETCDFTAELESPAVPIGFLRFQHDASAGSLEEVDGLFAAIPAFPAATAGYRALFDVGPDGAPFAAASSVLFTSPGGGGLPRTRRARRWSCWSRPSGSIESLHGDVAGDRARRRLDSQL